MIWHCCQHNQLLDTGEWQNQSSEMDQVKFTDYNAFCDTCDSIIFLNTPFV